MSLNSIMSLIHRLGRGRQTRAKFVSSQLDKFIAFQIRALRDREKMSQAELAEKLGTSQAAVHRYESPDKVRPTITTLKKIAAVFDVGLEVRFVPFSKLVRFVSGTPFVESGINSESFYVPSFEDDSLMNITEQSLDSATATGNEIGGQRRGRVPDTVKERDRG